MGKKLNKKENAKFWKEVTKQKKVESFNLSEWFQKSKWKPFLKKYYNYEDYAGNDYKPKKTNLKLELNVNI
jgi:hypothetical protein